MRARLRLGSPVVLVLWAAGCASTGSGTFPAVGSDVALDPSTKEGAAHAFPALQTPQGETLANGDFTQWLEGDRIHVKIRYEFEPRHWIEETSVVRQEPQLVQEQWSWQEVRGGELQRRFAVDFLTGEATAEKREGRELRRWSKHLDVVPGHAFAGAEWALAIKALRERLLRGEKIRLQTVGFTPKPRLAVVEISYAGRDELAMSGRTVVGERYLVHPVVAWVVRVFVDAPDSHIWMTYPPPAAFLRFEGPLAEPDDPAVRVDLLPGAPPAAPVGGAAPAARP